jgi:hypothetical protein
MAGKTSKKSAKVAKKDAAKRVAAKAAKPRRRPPSHRAPVRHGAKDDCSVSHQLAHLGQHHFGFVEMLEDIKGGDERKLSALHCLEISSNDDFRIACHA